MKRLSGLKLLEEGEGEGTPATKGDHVLFHMRLFLNKGDEVPLNEHRAEHLPKEMVQVVDGKTLIDRPITLGLGNDAIFARFCAAVQRTARDRRR